MTSAILVGVSVQLATVLQTAAQPSILPVHRPGDGVTAPTLVSSVPATSVGEAARLGIEGRVELECVVELDGSVGEVRVVKSVLPSLDEAAVAAVKKWRFTPGTKDGVPVRVLVEIEMPFIFGDNEPRLDSNDVFKPGPGVTTPLVLKEVKPEYPALVRASGIQGNVMLECVVKPDGTVGHTRVTQRLDPDLDLEAIRALKTWRFKPGERQGKPVPVQISVEMSFTLK